MQLASSSIRGALVAPPGRKLVIADLANIEGRKLAWLAGEEWKLQAFRDYDAGVGHDLYKLAYARSFAITVEDVIDSMRQIGKVLELSMGYEGGVGAFVTMALNYGMDLEQLADAALPTLPANVIAAARSFLEWRYENALARHRTLLQEGRPGWSQEHIERALRKARYGLTERVFVVCDSLKRLWRAAHPAICDKQTGLWVKCKNASLLAMANPEVPYQAGDWLSFIRKGSWLLMRLPSGRYVCYPGARVDGRDLSYMGVNQYTRKWCRIKTYGGKLCIARGTPVLTKTGWTPIEDITTDHLLWDGEEWCDHGGLLPKGRQRVIQAYGAWMTGGHEVLTTEGWKRASQSEGHQRAPCRIPDGYPIPRQRREEVAVGGSLRLRDREADGRERTAETGDARDRRVVRLHAEGVDRREAAFPRDEQAPGVRGVALDVRPLSAADASGVAQLWRPWHSRLQALARQLRGVLVRHGAFIPSWADDRARGQQRPVLTRELHVGDVQAAGEQPTTVAEVFDIFCVGPRKRFVIAAGGEPLIVHNCENATQASSRDVLAAGMFAAEASGYEIVLDVHDELVTETDDTPEFSAAGLSACMTRELEWAPGLPLAAKGFETYRYKKE
jgi:DNA polymerase bacteriophage-type